MSITETSKILSGDLTCVNQLRPSRHPWAWDLYIKSQDNIWHPNEVAMQEDITQWRTGALTEDEKLIVKRTIGFFSGTESLVGNNLLLSIFRWVCDGECRMYLIRQAGEEAIHNHMVVHVADSLDLNVKEVFEAYKSIPSIKAKDEFLMRITSDLGRAGFDITSTSGKQEFIRNAVAFYVICEGILFYSGFAMMLQFSRRNLMNNLCEQINYTLRDESLHIEFGAKLINTIIEQEPDIWTEEFKNELRALIREACELEVEYAKDVLPKGIMGMNSTMFIDYMNYIGNRRANSIGLGDLFPGAIRNPFEWMSETIDLRKSVKFFERKVTEYKLSASSLIDDL